MMRNVLFVLAAMCLAACASLPLPVSLARTEIHALKSDESVSYRLSISLPRDYSTVNKRYNVIYVLDAEYSFAITRNVVEHLSDRHHINDLIVVGIGYPGGIEGDGWLRRYRLARTRDYTPTYSKRGYPDGVQDVSGRADAFASFIEKKLVPYVDAHFRTSDNRTWVGHSYAGLFVLYASLKRPSLFNHTLSVSPSLWYDHRVIFKMLDHPISNSHFFISAGSLENIDAEGDIAGDVERFSQKLRETCPTCDVTTVLFGGENHDTVFPTALTRGLVELQGSKPNN